MTKRTNKLVALLTALLMMCLNVKTIQVNAGNSFSDVSNNTPHHDDITWMADNNISTGWQEANGTYTFRGMDTVKRQDMAAFLRREAIKMGIHGADTWTPSTAEWNWFSDVDRNTPHAEDILWSLRYGIVAGYTDGKFRGMDPVYRQDMAAFLHRLAKVAGMPDNSGTKNFYDVNSSTPHYEDIQWLGATGISTGYQDGSFQGMTPVYRQDMAAFIHREDNLNNNTVKYNWSSVPGGQSKINDGYLVEWAPKYYAAHNWTSYGKALLNTMRVGDKVILNGRTIKMDGNIHVETNETLENVEAKTGYPDACFQTCDITVLGTKYLIWYGHYIS